MSSQLPSETIAQLLQALGGLARLVAGGTPPTDTQLRILLLGVGLESDPAAGQELRRWADLLTTLAQSPTFENRQATVEALMLRGIPEAAAMLAVSVVASGGKEQAAPPTRRLTASVASLDLGTLSPGQGATAEFEVQGGPGQVVAESDQVRVTPEQFGAGATRIRVEVKPLTGGVLWTTLRLVTAGETLEVPVVAQWVEPSPSPVPEEDGRWVWEDEDLRDFALELDGPPPMDLFNRIISAVGERAKESGKVEVPIERILPPRPQWWQESSAQGLSVPLGPAGARKAQNLTLGSGTSQHVLVAGKTGSGKSTLLHVLITNLALRYSPDEVQLYLVDFKKGVEFKPYAAYNLPHARVVAVESEREFGLSVLQGLDAELKRRGDLFRAAGVDHIADYRAKALTPTPRPGGHPPSPLPNLGEEKGGRGDEVRALPRILLIVDEFQEFFTEDDPIASQAAQVLDRLVRQGRAFGVHVLLGSQTLAGSYTLARSTIDQMAVRIALQCSEADSRLILADDNPAARLLSRPGEAIYNDANGLVEGNHPFQVAWLSDEQREKYLQEIAALATERQYRPPQPQIVFEGNAPAEVEKNRPLADLLAAPTWPARGRRVNAWLGEPIAIAEPTAAAFRRQSGSNLLIVGQNDESALGMMVVALISLAAQHPSPAVGRGDGGEGLPSPSGRGAGGEGPTFYVLDFGAVDAPYAGLWDTLAGLLPHTVKVGRRRQLPDLIGELAAEVQARLDHEQPGAPSRYLFLYGLQRARDLRQEEMGFGGFSSFGEEPAAPNLAQQFATILREGPDLGVHTVVWCDTVTNLNRSLDRRSLREFAMRVVFQMSAEDSANLIDSPAASKLGPYRALFYDEEEGRLEKFRPYGVPSATWLEQVKGWFGARR